MASITEIVEDASPTKYFSKPPYHVESFPIGSCVCTESGFNCLSFKSTPGAKFTDLASADKICEKWNNEKVTA